MGEKLKEDAQYVVLTGDESDGEEGSKPKPNHNPNPNANPKPKPNTKPNPKN